MGEYIIFKHRVPVKIIYNTEMSPRKKVCVMCRYRSVCGRWYQKWQRERDLCCYCQVKICQELINEGCGIVEWNQKNFVEWLAKRFRCYCREIKKPKSKREIAWCQKCEKAITPASKKGVIKNRNDARFWGLKIKERVLCGDCLKQYQPLMPARKKYAFNDYQKRGYWDKEI